MRIFLQFVMSKCRPLSVLSNMRTIPLEIIIIIAIEIIIIIIIVE